MKMTVIERFIPAAQWLKKYSREDMQHDTVAGLVFTILVIPQSLAYAMLAGLPAVTGLYASILPSIAYSLFGSSRTLAVGPVAITSIMTATIVAPFAAVGTEQYVTVAMLLAFISGLFLIAMSVLRLGFLSNLLSFPVISGFISASAILIALGQLKHLLGIHAGGDTIYPLVKSLLGNLHYTNLLTLAISVFAIVSLVLLRRYFTPFLKLMGCSEKASKLLGKAGPILVVAAATSLVYFLSLDRMGVDIVGSVSSHLPKLHFELINYETVKQLLSGAFFISVVGFVGSVSVAQSFAAKRREDINPNQELSGLGIANIAAAISGSLPVTGGFSRTVLNADTGARTPMTGILSAILILLTLLFCTELFYFLPKAVLSATISVSIVQLINIKDAIQLWRFSKKEAILLIVTFLTVLIQGMEAGLVVGVVLALLFFLWHTSHPHIAVVGRVPGTEHFRNVQRFTVETDPSILTVRIDENLFFANARILEERIQALVSENKRVKHLILMCNAVNMIDASALQSIELIAGRLKDAGVDLHLSEVKGPVMDKLKDTVLLKQLSGEIFLTQHQAIKHLESDQTAQRSV